MSEEANVAVVLEAYDVENPKLVLREVPTPTPGEGQVLLRITHRPINPSDLSSLTGGYAGFQAKLPAVVGLEGVGKVAANGPGASRFAVGQRVVSVSGSKSGSGTWQRYVLREESVLFPVPDEVDDFQAAQFLVNPHTAFGFVYSAEKEGLLPPGGWILSNAASSALGFGLTRLAKKRGYKIVDVVRSEKWVGALEAAGADLVLVSGRDDIVAAVREATGSSGVDVAFDPVAGEGSALAASATKDRGTVFVYGALGGLRTVALSLGDVVFRYVSVRGWWLTRWLGQEVSPEERQAVHAEVASLIADGTLATPVGKSFRLDQFEEALEESRRPGRNEKTFFVD